MNSASVDAAPYMNTMERSPAAHGLLASLHNAL